MKRAAAPVSISAALCLFAILGSVRPAHASDNVSSLFKSASINWMLQDVFDNQTDVLEWSVELDAGDLPVEVELEWSGGESDKDNGKRGQSGKLVPVLHAVRLVYPDDTPPDQRMSYVEICARGANMEPFRTLYRGPVDPGDPAPFIKAGPHAAQSVRIRFLGAESEAPVLPRLELLGDESASTAGPQAADPVTRSYVAFLSGEPVGRYTWEREGMEDGYAYKSHSFMELKYRDDETGEEQNQGFEQICSFETRSDHTITAMDCEYPLDDKWIQGEVGERDLIVEGDGFDADGIEDEEEDGEGGASRHWPRQRRKSEKKHFPMKLTPLRDLVHGATIYDYLAARGLAHGVVRRISIVQPDDAAIINATARIVEFYPEREGRADLFVALVDSDEDEDDYTRVALIDAKGEVLREFNYAGGFEWWAVEDPGEWDLEPLIVDSQMLLEYMREQLHNVIPLPDGVVRTRAAITWNETPPEFLDLEGPRQALVSLNQPEPGVYEAELEVIRRLPGEAPLNATGELSEAELAPYLLYDETIDSNHEDIIEKAREIADGATSPMEVSRRIFNWLVRSFDPREINEYHVPPASTILKSMTGDCKHFAVLFAALARARKIPARFVFGQRYIGGSYGYHVWNQIYIDGEWLDVDASDLAFVPGAMHIQLDTAASFNEKGHSGALLGFRPDPELLETETGAPDYSALRGSVPTEFADAYFQDAFFNFRIAYPQHLAHEVLDLGFIRKICFSLPDEPEFMANMYVLPVQGSIEKTLMFSGIGQQESLHMLDLFGAFESVSLSKYGTTAFGGGLGMYVLGSFRNDEGLQIKFDLTILPADDRIFIFHYAATPEVYGHYNAHVGYIKKSLEVF